MHTDTPTQMDRLLAFYTCKLAALQARQKHMKTVNAYYRKRKTLDNCPDLSPEGKEELTIEMAKRRHGPDRPFLPCQLSSNNTKIRRIKSRIAAVTHQHEAVYVGWQFSGGRAEINQEAHRLQIRFDSKPDAPLREELKSHGFRWSPKAKAWQRQLNDNAIRAVDAIKALHPSSGETPSELQRKARNAV